MKGRHVLFFRAVLTEWLPCLRSEGRGLDRLKPRRRSVQPCLDGSAGSGPRDHRHTPQHWQIDLDLVDKALEAFQDPLLLLFTADIAT